MNAKEIKLIEKKMVNGHNDFYHSYCITKENWDKLKKILEFKTNKRIEEIRFVYDNNSLNDRSEGIILNLIKEFGGEINW